MPAVRVALPSHEAMVENIVLTFGQATLDQASAGVRWYPDAERLTRLIADRTGVGQPRVIHALAALSPRNPWLWNVADAFSYAEAARAGRPMPSATTYRRNQIAAWRALTDEGQPWKTAAPKVRNFVAAIMGDPRAVVVDVWAIRVATAGAADYVGGDARYAKVEAAYRDAASRLGVSPRALQATTWIVAQQAGRRAGYTRVFKAGTPTFLREALSA